MSVLSTLLATLKADATLMALLPGGIYTTWTTDGILPRLILAFSTTQTVGYKIRNGTLTIDVFTAKNDLASVELISKRIIAVLEGATLDSDETGPTLRVTLFSEGTVPEPDDRSAHYNMVLSIRFYRKAALGQET